MVYHSSCRPIGSSPRVGSSRNRTLGLASSARAISSRRRVGDDVFELTGTGTGIDLAAGTPRSPDAVITIKPDLLYALASRCATPELALERVEVAGDAAVAEQVLEALSGAAG
jgi:hypothetical protein